MNSLSVGHIRSPRSNSLSSPRSNGSLTPDNTPRITDRTTPLTKKPVIFTSPAKPFSPKDHDLSSIKLDFSRFQDAADFIKGYKLPDNFQDDGHKAQIKYNLLKYFHNGVSKNLDADVLLNNLNTVVINSLANPNYLIPIDFNTSNSGPQYQIVKKESNPYNLEQLDKMIDTFTTFVTGGSFKGYHRSGSRENLSICLINLLADPNYNPPLPVSRKLFEDIKSTVVVVKEPVPNLDDSASLEKSKSAELLQEENPVKRQRSYSESSVLTPPSKPLGRVGSFSRVVSEELELTEGGKDHVTRKGSFASVVVEGPLVESKSDATIVEGYSLPRQIPSGLPTPVNGTVAPKSSLSHLECLFKSVTPTRNHRSSGKHDGLLQSSSQKGISPDSRSPGESCGSRLFTPKFLTH